MEHILEQLFGSIPRVRILRLFMQNLEAGFSLTEIAERCQIELSAVRRELKRLVRANLLRERNSIVKEKNNNTKKKKTQGKIVVAYTINPNFPLLDEVHSLVTKSFMASRKRLRTEIQKLGHVKLTVLSGIFLNNDRARTDLLIVGDKIDKRQLDVLLCRIESELGRPLQYTLMDTHEFKYRMDMYDRFLRDILERNHEKLINKLNIWIKKRLANKERTLITTLTKRSAEDLTDFLLDAGFKVKYLHSDIETLERVEILRDLRLGKFDVLVGINLLREGLDLPEVSLIAIFDADKQGFLRSTPALIQTIGRCARNVNGFVIMYADKMTDAMKGALSETDRRRTIQIAYNKKHGITPQTIVKAIRELHMPSKKEKGKKHIDAKKIPREELGRFIGSLEAQMDLAVQNLEFEKAAELRDEIEELKKKL